MAIAAMLLMSPVAFASTAQDVEASSVVAGPKCEFSLSHYNGTLTIISSRVYTEPFKVFLNCPVTGKDVYATVHVSIDGATVTGAVVKIPAGKTESAKTEIAVKGISGKRYTLTVSEYI